MFHLLWVYHLYNELITSIKIKNEAFYFVDEVNNLLELVNTLVEVVNNLIEAVNNLLEVAKSFIKAVNSLLELANSFIKGVNSLLELVNNLNFALDIVVLQVGYSKIGVISLDLLIHNQPFVINNTSVLR